MRRLEAEAIRDAVLAVSGELNTTPPASSVVQKFPIAPIGRRRNRGSTNFAEYNHRSVYLPIVRSNVPGYLRTFDFPEPSEVKGNRDVTTVATQALFMMNHPFVRAQAKLTAERLLGDSQPKETQRIDHAYLRILGRHPTAAEVVLSQEFLKSVVDTTENGRVEAWTQMVQSLFSTIDFRYVR